MWTVKRIKYLAAHWRLGIHLLFRTRHFGVNNMRRLSQFDSMFGVSKMQIFKDIICVKPIIDNWKRMKFRAKVAYFVSDEEYMLLFGEERYPKEQNRKGTKNDKDKDKNNCKESGLG